MHIEGNQKAQIALQKTNPKESAVSADEILRELVLVTTIGQPYPQVRRLVVVVVVVRFYECAIVFGTIVTVISVLLVRYPKGAHRRGRGARRAAGGAAQAQRQARTRFLG